MFKVWDIIYFKLKKRDIEEGKNNIRKIKIDNILNCITKNCWKYNIQYQVILKNNDILIIKIIGKSESILLKYHRVNMVFLFDFDSFINCIDYYNVKRAIYITTGQFHDRITRFFKGRSNKKDILLEDSFNFIKYQLGVTGKGKEILNNEKLKFFKYFPD